MSTTNFESLWLFTLVSKYQSLTPTPFVILLGSCLTLTLAITLIFWAHPGGPAWGIYTWAQKYPTSGPTIPGPNGFPIIGSMSLMTGLAHRKLGAAAAVESSRLMAFSVGHTRVIITCNPDVAKQILLSSAFVDRPLNESAHNLMFNRSIGFAAYGAHWATLRKIADAHLFSPNQLKVSQHHRLDTANRLVRDLLYRGDMTPIRVRDFLKRASLDNMMCSVFGVDSVDYETEELNYLVDQGYDLLAKLNCSDHLPFLACFDLQKVRFRCSRLVPRVNRFVDRIISNRKAKTGGADFVDVLLSLDHKLSDSDLIAFLWEMIFRGTDTVAVLTEWILARLMLHPDVQLKIQRELDTVTGGTRAVDESDLTELVYLKAVVKEVLRLHPPGPLLSWSRLSIRDSVVDGYHVPKGTTAMVNMWAIMRDPKVWPDPLSFNPDRFLAGSGFSIFGSDLRIAPFGSGRRSCPGKALGMNTVYMLVARLLQEFELGCPSDGVDLSEKLRLSCEMANPLMVWLRSRRCLSK